MKVITPLQNLEVEMRILDIDTTTLLRELTELGAATGSPRLLVTTWIADPHGQRYRLRQDGDVLTLERKVKQVSSGEHISISEEQSVIIGKYSFSDIYTLAESLGYSVITSNTKTRTAYILSLEEGSVEVALDTYDTIDGTTIPTYMEIEAKSLTDTNISESETLERATSMVHRVAEILGYSKTSHSMMNTQKMVEHYKQIQESEKQKWIEEIAREEARETQGMSEVHKKMYTLRKNIDMSQKFGKIMAVSQAVSIEIDIKFIIESHLKSRLLEPRKQAHYERLSNTLYKDQFIMHDAIAHRHPFSGHVTEEESKWLASIGIRYKAYIASLGYTISQYEYTLADDTRKDIYDTFIQREWKSYKEHPFQAHINSGLLRRDTTTLEIFLSDQ